MIERAIRLLAVIGVLLVAGFALLSANAGEFRSLEPISGGECRQVLGAPGSEDITVTRPSGFAFLSSDPRATPGRPGSVLGLDLTDPEAQPINLTADLDFELHPHGISFFEGFSKDLLFVIHHGEDGSHEVLRFGWDGELLTLEERFESPLLLSPNDLVALGPEEFYVTNDHGAAAGLARTMEDLLRQRRANVVHYKEGQWSEAATEIAYANGINTSPQADELYVASTTRGELHRFKRDLDSGELERTEVMQLGTGLDNIDVDRHGALWIAAHPKLLSFTRHARNPQRHSPSEVLWVDPWNNHEPPVRQVYVDLGEELSGSSVAVPFGSRIVIGSVFEEHVLVCERGG